MRFSAIDALDRSDRLSLVHALATALTYFLAVTAAVGFTRFGGGVACVWLAGAIIVASLAQLDPRHWWPTIVLCWVAGTVASALFGVGPVAAPFVGTANIVEALVASTLIHRWGLQRSALDSLDRFGAFIVACGIVAPAISAPFAAYAVSAATGTAFATNLLNWYIGHALGMLCFTPVCAMIAAGDIARWWNNVGRAQHLRAVGMFGAIAAVTAAVFAQSSFPLLFVPTLPLIVSTFRLGRVGAVLGVILIGIIGGAFTFAGYGPVSLMRATDASHIQFFQLYLAVTAMTALPVSADLAKRRAVLSALRDSEARFRLITDNSTDVVINIDIAGHIGYISPSITKMSGHDPAALVGTNSMHLVAPEDRAAVTAAHLEALGNPGTTVLVEHRGGLQKDRERWFETHTCAVLNDAGAVTGMVCAIRETTSRRSREHALTREAQTDALTGIANRRAFDAIMAEHFDREDRAGCLAVFDLDHFKYVNDVHGHPAGDDVLRGFATLAAGALRDGDIIARIGGEEFAVLLPKASLPQAIKVCERIRAALARQAIRTHGRDIRVTVSAGVSDLSRAASPDDAVAQADAALYEAKADGRDRLAIAA